MSSRPPPPRPTPEQRLAAEPRRSVWVDANAGTGKTRVLTDRVLRLLLGGAKPESVLCLTYTKAAAGEMLQRVGERLALWATLDDADLAAELEALEDERPSPRRLDHARLLHDAVLALPGGLAIMTLHSLAQMLLRRFPLEAGVPASFEVIDDRTRRELLDEARERVLARALDDAESRADLEILAASAADGTVLGAVDALIDARRDWARARAAAGGLEQVVAKLARALDVDPERGAAAIGADAASEDAFDRPALLNAAETLAGAKQKTRREAAEAIRQWLARPPDERASGLVDYAKALTTVDKGPPPQLRAKANLKLDGLAAEAPAAAAALDAEIARLDAVDRALRGTRLFERTRALLRLADRVLEAFEAAKAEAAVLDFDDLLLRTRALLAEPGAGDWVRYKLDQAYTHILVDEAQDTNTLQWAIIELLLEEVFAGEGTRSSGGRTLFVVGDAKQSIYRFQGADPEATGRVRGRIEARAGDAGLAIEPVALTTSFRSSQAVLDVVDALLDEPGVSARLGTAGAHRAFQVSRGGRVELWPLLEAEDAPAPADPWAVPPLPRHGERAERRLARLIAETLAGWLGSGLVLPGSGRPLVPGDVMVLLRRREPMQEPLVRALKQAGVPVMGADRLALTDHLAVQDLVNLGRAVLLAEDDFAFACALKSPLLGLDDDALFTLAHGRRKGETLQERLRLGGGEDTALAPVWERFRRWQRLADFVPAYEFYLSVLTGEVARADGAAPFEGRRALLERFGPEATEPIEAFLEQALVYERGHAATLEGFLHWLQRGDESVKREAEPTALGVRVLTVHGAKGLEAPLVILADAGPRSSPRPTSLLWNAERDLVFWRPSKEGHVPASAAAREAEAAAETADDLRLLYVASTRAAEWLVVAGTRPRRPGGDMGWHGRLGQALETLGANKAEAPDGLDGERLVYATGVTATVETAPPAPVAVPPLPEALRTLPPPAGRRVRVRPSDAEGGIGGGAGGERQQARAVGRHVHALLERLPALPVAARAEAQERYLAAVGDLDPPSMERVRRQVQAILDEPSLAPLFGADAWVEQPILGEVNGVRVSGQVDRMALVGDELWICDFKTGRPPAPGRAPPAEHASQLAAYVALARPLFPGVRTRARLIWTETGLVQTLDDAVLEAYMPGPRD